MADSFQALQRHSEIVPFTGSEANISYLEQVPAELEIAGIQLQLNAIGEFNKTIYLALIAAINSDWYEGLTKYSKISGASAIKTFVKWFNHQKITSNNQYTFLNEYQSFRVNECGVKPQSTGLNILLIYLSKAAESKYATDALIKYIYKVKNQTNKLPNASPEQDSIGKWFAQIPWLRSEMLEEEFLNLASPKKLCDSFSICIATILIYIIETKNLARKQLGVNLDEFANFQLHSPQNLEKTENAEASIYSKSRANRQRYLGNLSLYLCKNLQSEQPNPVKELFLLDCVSQKNRNTLQEVITKIENKGLAKYRQHITGRQIFGLPNIFAEEAWQYPSEIEQLLFSWLCAWLTVQPFDIQKLKINHFTISRDDCGRPISIQCTYYKGRSGRSLQPFLLDAGQIEGKAILAYLESIPHNVHHVFRINTQSIQQLTFGKNSNVERLAHLFQYPIIHDQIKQNCRLRNSSAVFMNLYLNLYKFKDTTYSKWLNLKKRLKENVSSTNAYCKEIPFNLPLTLFGLNAIKNTSVHSRTDRYRVNDLINYNSHTTESEKHCYLTDSNKEWVNQHGRITRTVLLDITKFVYQPNIAISLQIAHELTIKTQIIQISSETAHDDVRIDQLGRVSLDQFSKFQIDINEHAVLVLDSVETVVVMLHYIEQAKTKQTLLVNNCLDFFERKVLPTAEWMETLLTTRLSPKNIGLGLKEYEEVLSILPPLFEIEIKYGGVT